MIEPAAPTLTSVSLLNLFVLALGAQAGPWGFLLFGALSGGWLALREAGTGSNFGAARFLVGRMALSMLFTFPLAWVVTQAWATVPIDMVLGLTSCMIAWQWGWLSREMVRRLKVTVITLKGDAP